MSLFSVNLSLRQCKFPSVIRISTKGLTYNQFSIEFAIEENEHTHTEGKEKKRNEEITRRTNRMITGSFRHTDIFTFEIENGNVSIFCNPSHSHIHTPSASTMEQIAITRFKRIKLDFRFLLATFQLPIQICQPGGVFSYVRIDIAVQYMWEQK